MGSSTKWQKIELSTDKWVHFIPRKQLNGFINRQAWNLLNLTKFLKTSRTDEMQFDFDTPQATLSPIRLSDTRPV